MSLYTPPHQIFRDPYLVKLILYVVTEENLHPPMAIQPLPTYYDLHSTVH